MKQNVVLLLLLFGLSLSAQNFEGKAEYISKRIVLNNGAQKQIKSKEEAEIDKASKISMEKACNKKYELIFNDFEALYKEVKQLDKPNPDGGIEVFTTFEDDGTKYINLKTKEFLKEEFIFEEDFLIADSLKNYNWKLVAESKKIGDYTCYKATTTLPIPKKEKDSYDKYLKEKEAGKHSFFSRKEPRETIVTAWYASSIPTSLGPCGYWGLPGLILEINSESLILVCSEISIKLRDTTKIKAPNSNKKLSPVEFDKLEEKKWADFHAKAIPNKN